MSVASCGSDPRVETMGQRVSGNRTEVTELWRLLGMHQTYITRWENRQFGQTPGRDRSCPCNVGKVGGRSFYGYFACLVWPVKGLVTPVFLDGCRLDECEERRSGGLLTSVQDWHVKAALVPV